MTGMTTVFTTIRRLTGITNLRASVKIAQQWLLLPWLPN